MCRLQRHGCSATDLESDAVPEIPASESQQFLTHAAQYT